MLVVKIVNDRSGDEEIGNYRYEVLVNLTSIAKGIILKHNRKTGWQGLLRDLLRQNRDDINSIWTITTVKNAGDARKVGWYFFKEDAIEAIECNNLDINECLHYPYAFAVAEKLGTGTYPHSYERIWFKWEGDEQTGKYIRLEKTPEEFENVVNWSIG